MWVMLVYWCRNFNTRTHATDVSNWRWEWYSNRMHEIRIIVRDKKNLNPIVKLFKLIAYLFRLILHFGNNYPLYNALFIQFPLKEANNRLTRTVQIDRRYRSQLCVIANLYILLCCRFGGRKFGQREIYEKKL